MSAPHSGFRTGCLGALVVLLALSGCTSLPTACPAPAEVKPEQLHGIWTVQLDGTGTPWTLQLGPHPEHQGSLRGELTQGTLRYPVVADLEGGEFTLEESHDGQRIAATWLGTVVAGSCGRVLQGQRIGPQERRQAFLMQP
jgi:hypothetical protein